MKVDDDTKRRLKRAARKTLPFLIEFGSQEDIVAYARKWNPNITPQQLERVVKLFLDAQREREHSPRLR
jgi:hypothetical protein